MPTTRITVPLIACLLRRPFGAAAARALLAAAAVPALGFAADVPLDALAAQASAYASGASAEPLRALEQRLREAAGNPDRLRALETALARLLAPESTFEAKRFACQQLAVCGTEASVPALAALLRDQEAAGLACYALAGIKSEKAGEALRAALAECRGSGRLRLVAALAHRAEAASVALLSGLARDPDAALASAAARALGSINAPQARAAVDVLLRAPRPEVAGAVAEAAMQGAEQLAAEGARDEAAALCERLLAPSRPAHVRRGALGLLLRSDADGGVERALRLIAEGSADETLVPVALARLPELKGDAVSRRAGDLMERLSAPHQALLVEALAARGDNEARECLRKALGSRDACVRQAAARAVARLDGAAAASQLAGSLAAAGSPDEAKELQAALVELSGGEAADRALVEAFRGAAAAGRAALMPVFARRGGDVAVTLLLEEAAGRDEEASKAAAQALAQVAAAGDSRSFKALLSAAADADERMAEASLRALAAWRGPAAWEPLLHAYMKPDGGARHAVALKGLVRLAAEGNARPDAAAVERYRQLLACSQSDADRAAILRVLAGAAHPDALALALPLLERPALRGVAEEAVRRLAAALEATQPEAARSALQRLQPGEAK